VLKKEGSNGEFNQSLSPRSVLVEVGGVDNTLAEGYRSAGILAEVLAEMYWEETDAVEASAQSNAD
jgi:stage II sporulation protein P